MMMMKTMAAAYIVYRLRIRIKIYIFIIKNEKKKHYYRYSQLAMLEPVQQEN